MTTLSNQADFQPSDRALLQLGRALQASGYAFTTPTPATHERVNDRAGNEWAQNIAGVLGWSRPFQPAILPPEVWQLMQQAEVVAPHDEGFRALVRASTLGEQLFFHSAFPTSANDSVFFGPDTYRFVTAIETLLHSELPPMHRAVDVCCGAGPGAISLASSRPEVPVLAVDINDNALRLTRINAALAGATHVEARHSNLLIDVDGEFDLIVANPPYLVDASERAYRHGGGPLGAGLSLAIVEAALQRLAPGGTLLLYTGVAMLEGRDPFHGAVAQILASSGAKWSYRGVDPDVFGEELLNGPYIHADRIAAVVLTITQVR